MICKLDDAILQFSSEITQSIQYCDGLSTVVFHSGIRLNGI